MDLLQDRIFDITNNINDFTDNGFFPFEGDLGNGLDDLNNLQSLNESSLNELSGQDQLVSSEIIGKINTEFLFANDSTENNSLTGILSNGNTILDSIPITHDNSHYQLNPEKFSILQNNVNLQPPVNIQRTLSAEKLKKGSLSQIQKGLSKSNTEMMDPTSFKKDDELDFDDFFNVEKE